MPEWPQKIINSKSKTWLAFCFCFIAGAGVFSFLENRNFLFYLYISLFLILFFVIILWHKKRERFLLLYLLFFVLGGLRFLVGIPGHDASRIEFYNGRKINLQGWVAREPEIGLSEARYVISVEKLKDGKTIQPVSGKILVQNRLYPEYRYGDELEITCLLGEPENFADSSFNYQKYLAKRGVWSVCGYPAITALGGNRGNFFIKTMSRFKSAVADRISELWPEPAGSLMAGILYGSRSGLPKELADNFARTGISHIVAVSGYNVSIIAMILSVILIYLGLSRPQTFWLLVFLILSFVFFTGATASVVRAGSMAVIILLAQYWGRLSSVGRALLYAAVIMVLFNPYILIWDAGFQLSFLSTLGLVYLAPILQSALVSKIKIKNSALMVLTEIFTTTLAAIAATIPLILFQFGRLSLVAPLVNVLILWLVPWLMLFGFLALVFSRLFFPLGQAVAWVAGLGLNYVIIIVDWFGNKSWSAVNMRLPPWIMILMYLALILYVKKNKTSVVRGGL